MPDDAPVTTASGRVLEAMSMTSLMHQSKSFDGKESRRACDADRLLRRRGTATRPIVERVEWLCVTRAVALWRSPPKIMELLSEPGAESSSDAFQFLARLDEERSEG